MIIKKIKVLKKKVNILFSNNELLELDKEIYPNFYLYEGKDISSKELKEIKEYNNVSSLLKYALHVRSKAIYSEYQIREKLYKKEASKKEVDKVIKVLKNYDLIDDNAFTLDYIEYYNSMNYGKNKIISKLLEKGIFKEKLEKIHFPINVERRKAKNIFSKLEKKYEKYNYSQKKEHLYNAYLANGFDKEIALEMTSLLKSGSIKEENEKLKRDYEKIFERLKRKYQGKELKQKVVTNLLSKGYKINDVMALIERKKL